MRIRKRWYRKKAPQLLKKYFTPRIIEDFENLGLIDDLPGPIESSVYLYGETGTGKTLKACQYLMAQELDNYMKIQFGKCHFVSVPHFFNQLKNQFNDGSANFDLIAELCTVDFLVLDEIGIKKVNDWAIETLYYIINHRYEWKLKTVITSNYSLQELSEKLGDDRITDRIQRSYKVVKKKL